jgi:hypothetical protein
MTTTRTYQTIFTVEGKGRFPLDMLRYDSAVPASEGDAHRIEKQRDLRTVTLIRTSVNKLGPTVGRWESFGWTVHTDTPIGPAVG